MTVGMNVEQLASFFVEYKKVLRSRAKHSPWYTVQCTLYTAGKQSKFLSLYSTYLGGRSIYTPVFGRLVYIYPCITNICDSLAGPGGPLDTTNLVFEDV